MADFQTANFDKLDSAGTPRSGLFFRFCRLFGKDKIGNFVTVFSNDNDSPTKGELTNIIDGNTSTVYESGKENTSIILYFPYHKLKIIKYSLTSEGKPTDMKQMANWTLEGTTDNNDWMMLDQREKVTDLQGIARARVYEIKNDTFFKAFKLSSIDHITISAIEFFGYAEADSNKIDFANQPKKRSQTIEPAKPSNIVNKPNTINQQLLNRLSQIYAQGPKPPEKNEESNTSLSSKDDDDDDEPVLTATTENEPEIKLTPTIIRRNEQPESKTKREEPETNTKSQFANARREETETNIKSQFANTRREEPETNTKSPFANARREEPEYNKKILSPSSSGQKTNVNSDDSFILPNVDSNVYTYKFPPKIAPREVKPKEEEEEKVETPKEEEPKKIEKPPEDLLPLPKPEISSKDQHWMSISLNCNNSSDFYNGIFKMMKSRFSRPSSTAGFVEIFADTKKQMPLTIHNLVDCMKATDWYSTKMNTPAISLYFPFHLLSINAIGFRSHVDKHFGRHFLTKFVIHAINDKKEIVHIGTFETNKLNDFEAKATYQLRIPFPVRALRIESQCGKFGLSFIELYGTGIYSEIETQFSKDFLTDPSLYKDENSSKKYRDNDNPHKSIKKKLVSKVKKMLDNNDGDEYIREWSDHSDEEEENNKKKQQEQQKPKPQPKPKAVPVNVKKEITIDFVDATDPKGPSIVQKFENIVENMISLEEISKEDISVCSYIAKHQPSKPKKKILFLFTNLKIKLTGIKIRTSNNLDNTPYGFNFVGHCHNDESSHEEWRIIFSSQKEKFKPNRDYYYPIETDAEYTDFMIRSYGYDFIIDFIDFYGTATVNKSGRNQKEVLEIQKRNCIVFDDPPVASILFTNKPGIFEKMMRYYGTMLCGFVDIYSNRAKSYVSTFFANESFSSLNVSHPGFILYFPAHNALVTEIVITANEKDKCLKRFFITNENNVILADIDFQFQPNQKRGFQLDHESIKPYHYLKVFSLSGTFKCKSVELYGEFLGSGSYFKSVDKKQLDFDNNLFNDMKNKEINMGFEKERQSARPNNPRILFSADGESYDDVISYGLSRYKDFVTFYNYGENGHSLLNRNKENLWMTSSTNDQNSFTILFNHVSVRLMKFGIRTPPRPGFEDYMPKDFYLFGYSTLTNRWDVLIEHSNSNPLEIMSYYTFKVENECKNNFYRMFQFLTVSGRVALSYVTLFGDVIEENDPSPKNVASKGSFSVVYEHMPQIVAQQIPKKFSPGIFRKAQSIFGPLLEGFVDVRLYPGEDTRYFDIWEARRGCYNSKRNNRKKAISFYFPHHVVYIEGFQIKPDIYPGLENFVIAGYNDSDDRGTILAVKTDFEMKNRDSYYWDSTKYQRAGFRIVRFFGLDDYYSFSSLDFLGIAKPTERVLTEEEMSSSYYIPSVVENY